jgi:uncharacterized membrane protein
MSRSGLKIALAASLVVNVFTIGAIGGLVYIGAQIGAARVAARQNPLVRAADDLTPANQAAFKQTLRQTMALERPTMGDSRLARRRTMDLFEATAFDPAATKAAMAQARADDLQVRARLEEAVVDFAARLTPAERHALADGFRRRAIARWVANHPAAKPGATSGFEK